MLRAFLVAVSLTYAARGQGSAAFDVASVRASKLVAEGSRREKIDANPGTVSMRNVSLKSAIKWAYHLMDYQISGPEWLGFERFDISAKAGGDPPENQLRLMMQGLLADRFKLAVHTQTKELPAYVMVVSKGGIKFHESQLEGDGEPVVNPDKAHMGVEIKGLRAEQFVDMLSTVLHTPVINETGLKGRYDAKIDIGKYMPDGSAGSAPFDPVAIIITGMQEELGLKLEAKKMPLQLLIIDHVEKVPVDN